MQCKVIAMRCQRDDYKRYDKLKRLIIPKAARRRYCLYRSIELLALTALYPLHSSETLSPFRLVGLFKRDF